VYVKLEGAIAELLVKAKPYKISTLTKSVLFVFLKDALYLTLQAVMLFWKNITAKLTSIKFSTP